MEAQLLQFECTFVLMYLTIYCLVNFASSIIGELVFLLSDSMRIMSVIFVITLHQLPQVEIPLDKLVAGHWKLVPLIQPWQVLLCS